MANLIVCCDGTWNNPEQEDNAIPAPTNVVKLYHALDDLDDNNNVQKSYYHPGLGGEKTGLKDAVLDGALGKNIKRHICSAYHWIAQHYEPGDRVFIFGFSRGAFTARSLGGMLRLGLLDFLDMDEAQCWDKTHQHFSDYKSACENLNVTDFINNKEPFVVHFLGVWDTVGALGIPNDMEIFNLFDNPERWRFHDTCLGKHIKVARHAMALDEKRSSFCVTRWQGDVSHSDVKEQWFAGVHSDVGGGYSDCSLSDIALKWMLQEAQAHGLVFRDNVFAQLKPDAAGVLHNSYKGIFAKFRSRPRNVECVTPQNSEHFHPSVFERQIISPISHPKYWPTKKLAVGESVSVKVFAKQHWNRTYLFMDKDEKYSFSAQGHWQDGKDTCDWLGSEDGKLTRGDIIRFASSIWGIAERKFRQLSQNRSADFWGTKRIEHMPWFILVGCIANDAEQKTAVTNDGSPHPHQYVSLPNYQQGIKSLNVDSAGYFYAFANDVWSLYDNNQGSVLLTITRTH
ncbi:DUF2235 domain-containing protein [Pseudoalteromonas sp. MMG010]|uniref:DUF2235 domain-containing protein n=1 Tax=Pseudoalteromonas sp. MMG010 TaxID=2822685 RepID=UPI001B3A143A|nr:DUF2235 domain-containing protein [Pseudoalteromonas sp. MMG010]MBQ4831874.1 DUF2235 domain-containing protein [Pseudoalteromonas sp. MMG010]